MTEIYKVVKIISDEEIVVNAGYKQGIKKGQELEIFVPGEEVIDPDTGRSLGTLDTIKAYVTVRDVYENMCVCINSETATRNFLNPFEGFTITKPKRLNVDSTQISGGFKEDRIIRVGDLVRPSRG